MVKPYVLESNYTQNRYPKIRLPLIYPMVKFLLTPIRNFTCVSNRFYLEFLGKHDKIRHFTIYICKHEFILRATIMRMSANFQTGQNGQSIGSTLTWTSLDISPRTSCRYTMYAMNSNHAPISSGGTTREEQPESEHIDRMAIIKSFLMCKVFFGCYPNISR